MSIGHATGYAAAGAFFLMVAFCWIFYFRYDIRRWWVSRGPRRQLAMELAAEREAELERLRDELAAKYLDPNAAKRPTQGS
jgi:hypothetical protein